MNEINQKENKKKVFDDYDALCDDCQHYWNSVCDGVKVGSNKMCSSFKVIKKLDYGKRIEEIERKYDRIEVICFWTVIIGGLFLLAWCS